LVVDEVCRLNQDAKPLPHVVGQQHIDIARDWCVIGEALYAEVEGVVKWGLLGVQRDVGGPGSASFAPCSRDLHLNDDEPTAGDTVRILSGRNEWLSPISVGDSAQLTFPDQELLIRSSIYLSLQLLDSSAGLNHIVP